jgi:hypothetical protein
VLGVQVTSKATDGSIPGVAIGAPGGAVGFSAPGI